MPISLEDAKKNIRKRTGLKGKKLDQAAAKFVAKDRARRRRRRKN